MDNTTSIDDVLRQIQARLDEIDSKYMKYRQASKVEENLDEITQELNGLIGLDEVKGEVNKLINYLKFMAKVQGKAQLDKINLNMLFRGNPGTGKTTVARIMAKILYNLGYLENDCIIETTPREFIAGYIGQTAIKSRKLLDKYKGGLIFIDEAYSFNHEYGEKNFSDEAIAEIIKDMEAKETIFIFAGYDKEMDDFVDLNPGIKSRIGYDISFEDYSEDELYEIFSRKIEGSGFSISDEASKSIRKIISDNKKEKNFGNGRMIDNLYNKLMLEHASLTCDDSDLDKLFIISDEAARCINLKSNEDEALFYN